MTALKNPAAMLVNLTPEGCQDYQSVLYEAKHIKLENARNKVQILRAIELLLFCAFTLIKGTGSKLRLGTGKSWISFQTSFVGSSWGQEVILYGRQNDLSVATFYSMMSPLLSAHLDDVSGEVVRRLTWHRSGIFPGQPGVLCLLYWLPLSKWKILSMALINSLIFW